MATRLQIRQGTNTENDNFTGAPGELTFDTTNKEIRIHDGTTQGGITIANKQLLDTKLDKNISLNYNHITNCLTEIPQDVKAELFVDDNGVQKLRIKAGSKVYVPNGANIFDEIVLTSSLTTKGGISLPGIAANVFVMYDSELSMLTTHYMSSFYSGDTQPSEVSGLWYDTANNKIKYIDSDGVVTDTGYSLPLALIRASKPGLNASSKVTGIKNIFNGFGFMGSTVFALPGVKGLIPNGRNADGSLNNIQFAVEKPLYQNISTTNLDVWSILRIENGELVLKSTGTNTGGYNPNTNYNVFNDKNSISCIVTREYFNSDGKITTFTPKTVFHAVDYSDSNYISQQGMPSSKYINIPADKFGSTGTAHTAPGNGYFVIRTVANIADCTLTLQSAQEPYYGNSLFIPQGNDGRLFVPVKKGDQVILYYTNLGTGTEDQATVFNFIYSQGQ